MVREKEIPLQKSTPKPSYVRLLLPAGEATSAPPLSAILGQAKINSSDFCKNFNNFSSQAFEAGVLLNVDLYKNADDTYYFQIRGIFLPFILFQVSDDSKFISLELLYDSFRLKAISNGLDFNFSTVKNMFGSLRSINFKILFL
jgi:hypothetical protein